ncbi:hypothetical protein PG984_007211 [Apiospora sp. TS-2023a]
MRVFHRGGGRSRHLAKTAALMTNLGDRIVMYTDGSARDAPGYRQVVPRTAAVTYKSLYDGAHARDEPWHDHSYGILGVRGNNEAEVVAVAEALGILEHEVRAYVQSGRGGGQEEGEASSHQLLLLVFSDSDYCLGILNKMLVAVSRQGPFTGRDSTVDLLKANLLKLGEYIRSIDLQISLEFHCIKSHSKIIGNDRADRLATEAFTTAKLYFSGHQPLKSPGQHVVVDLVEMSRALQTPLPPPSDVYQTIADLRREFQEQRDEERQQSEKMASKLWEAVEELKRNSQLASTLLVDGEGASDSKPKPEKQRKRDVLAARIRRAGQRLRGFGRKTTAT